MINNATPPCNIKLLIEDYGVENLSFKISDFSLYSWGWSWFGVITSINDKYIYYNAKENIPSRSISIVNNLKQIVLNKIPKGYNYIDLRDISGKRIDRHVNLSKAICDNFEELKLGLCGKIYLCNKPRLLDVSDQPLITSIVCEDEDDPMILYMKISQLNY